MDTKPSKNSPPLRIICENPEAEWKRHNFKLDIFIAIAPATLTFANPTFVALIEKLF